MKKTLIIFLLLAVASLGLALPQSKVPLTPTPTPTPAPAPGSAPAPAAISPDSIDAALGGDLSKECTAAIFSIVTSPDFLKCIPVTAFVPLLPILTDPNFLKKLLADPAGTFKELEPQLVQFSTGFCVAPKCTNEGVSKAIKTLSEGCKAEIVSNPLIKLVFSATVFYSPLHDTVCFKSDKGKKFCWDESLTTIFSLPKSPIKIIDGGLLDSIAVSDPFAMCTKCNKDIVNTYVNFLKDNKLALQILANFGIDQKRLDLINVGIAVKCGIKFEDGTIEI